MVMGSLKQEVELAVIGAGPGGYVAALRAADLGMDVALIDDRDLPGGVCLLEGCIPSKTFIHAVETIQTIEHAERMGISVSGIEVDIDTLRRYKNKIVTGLGRGVKSLLKNRGVEHIKAKARFQSSNSLLVEGSEVSEIVFRHCIVATGSRSAKLDATRGVDVWTSKQALDLPEVPERLLVLGGGAVGLELGLVYAGLGSRVQLIESMPGLLTGVDSDLVEVLVKSAGKRFAEIMLQAHLDGVEKTSGGYAAAVTGLDGRKTLEVDRIIVAVGRKPNTNDLGLENTSIGVDSRGRIPVDELGRTREKGVYAVGDVTPGPMLAHRATRQAKVAAEAIAGMPSAFDNRAVPAVVYTDPEIAWTGLTELEAVARNIPYDIGRFPLKALGRAQLLSRTEGHVKVLADPDSKLVLGIGMVGPQVSELIAEAVLGIEMGATLEDFLTSMHPHPTLSESLMEAVETAAGTGVHLPAKAK